MPTVCVHLMTQEDLAAVEKLNLWEEAIETNGISKCHHAEMKDGILSIWKHAADVINDPINTVIYEYQKSLQSSSVEERQLQTGDFVKVVNGSFVGYYAVITGESYGDEIEINYFEKRERHFVLKENDMDSHQSPDLELVDGV